MDQTVWKGVVRRFWPGALREMQQGYMYAPQAVFRSPQGELVKWARTDTCDDSTPHVWWELRDRSGMLRAKVSHRDLKSMSIFRWSRYIIEGHARA